MGSEKIENLSDDEFEDAEELEELDELEGDLEPEEHEREDSALEDLKAVQAAISSEDDDDDDDLGGMSLGFGAQAAASLGGGASLAGTDGGSDLGSGASPSLSAGPSPAASMSPASSLIVDDGDDEPGAAASLASKSTLPASLTAAPVAATATAPPPEKNRTNWGIVAAIVAVALATVGAVAFVAINPQAGKNDPEEDVGVGRAALAGGAMAAGAANPTANLQKAARPLGAAPEAAPMADATKVAADAEAAALENLDAEGLILDEDDGEFEEGDPMHGGTKLERKKKKKVDIEYGLKRNKRDSGKDDGDEPDAEPVEPETTEPDAEVEPETTEPKVAKNEENIDCLLNPGAPGCKKYDMPKAETQKEQLPQKLSQRDIAMGLRAPKKSAKQCGQTHNSSEVVRVHVTISGNGTVKQVTAKGLHKGTPLGTCVEGFLSKATFPQFQNQTMGLDISVAM